jgi:hypothetical protein
VKKLRVRPQWRAIGTVPVGPHPIQISFVFPVKDFFFLLLYQKNTICNTLCITLYHERGRHTMYLPNKPPRAWKGAMGMIYLYIKKRGVKNE